MVFPELALTTFFPRWYIEDQDELKQWFYGGLSGSDAAPDDEFRQAFRKFLDSPHRVIIETEANLVVAFDTVKFAQFTNEAIKFIQANRAKPFFLYIPFTAPHFPAQAHPDWEGKSKLDAYGDVVEELDGRIGQILQALEDRELDKKTIVIFTSDNGPVARFGGTTGGLPGLTTSSARVLSIKARRLER